MDERGLLQNRGCRCLRRIGLDSSNSRLDPLSALANFEFDVLPLGDSITFRCGGHVALRPSQ